MIGSPSLRRDALDRLASQRSPAYAAHLSTYGRALQQRNGLLRLIREEQAVRGDLRFWDATLLEAGHRGPRGAPPAPGGARRAARPPPTRRSRRTRPSTDALGVGYATNAPQQPGRVGPRRPRPAPRRDRREGGLERDHADRPAPRRPGVRARRPADGLVRVARPAADGDPRVQARGAGPADGARRPPAAAAPRRRVLGAGPGAALAPRPADRGAAPGVRDDHDARRPRPGPPLGRDGVGRDPGRPTAPPGSSATATAGDERPGRDGATARARPSRPARPDRRPAARRPPAGWASRTSCASPGRSRPGTPSSPSGSRPRPAPAASSASSPTRSSSRRTSRSSRRSSGCGRRSCSTRSPRRPADGAPGSCGSSRDPPGRPGSPRPDPRV